MRKKSYKPHTDFSTTFFLTTNEHEFFLPDGNCMISQKFAVKIETTFSQVPTGW